MLQVVYFGQLVLNLSSSEGQKYNVGIYRHQRLNAVGAAVGEERTFSLVKPKDL